MKTENLIKIDKYIKIIDECNTNFVIALVTIIIYPFGCLYLSCKYIYNKLSGLFYKSDSKELVRKEEKEKELLKEKIKNREIPLNIQNHITPKKEDRFYFFEKRILSIPYDHLVYVESEYNEKIHRIFKNNAEWLEDWQKWHGWDIEEYNYEDIKEGMFYPQDFEVFKHGFLWHSPLSSWDKDSDLFGNIHYYYEIDPESETSIMEQMESFMRKIYNEIDT